MSVFVVDTNVAIVANTRDTHADRSCQLACINKLECVVRQGVVAVDKSGAILDEYGGYLSHSGQPGMGDAFFKHIFDHLYRDRRVRRVPVTPSNDDRKGFEELPENAFDRSDRVFLAVALVGGGDRADPSRFVGEPVVVTEKLDGGNTLLHAGKVYGRSVAAPSEGKWMAMVKKHHAWKVNEPNVFLYGEDIYGVHSIEYGQVPENETFYAFALRNAAGVFASFAELEAYANQREIPVVPVLFKGCFRSVAALRAFVEHAHGEASTLGGEREGVVLRLAREYPIQEFANNACKSVRLGHVNTDEHWTRNWRPCRISRTGR